MSEKSDIMTKVELIEYMMFLAEKYDVKIKILEFENNHIKLFVENEKTVLIRYTSYLYLIDRFKKTLTDERAEL